MVSFGAWWIENVLEELDAPREWFYNQSSKVLYYWPNTTSTSAGVTEANDDGGGSMGA